MSVVKRPQLPPKAGYVEVINAKGEHVYKPTSETEAKLKQEAEFSELHSTVSTVLGETQDGSQAALEFRKAVQLFVTSLTDETSMLEIASVYPEYQVGVAYTTGDVFRYGTNSVGDDQLYQVLQDHTSAAEWTPDTATSLYKKVGIAEDGTPIWVQPLGATDAYNTGDVVMYNGQKYQSLIDANVWSPDAYPAGWQLIETEEPTDPGETTDPEEPTEPEPEPEDPEETIPEFVQPTDASNAYNTGDIVMHNGQKYQSTMDGNVWSPDAYPDGWQLIE